jgi:DNA primase
MAHIEKLLERLEKVRRMGAGRYMACCPAHDDKNPSLSIRDDGERVLIHCFAGCDSQDVIDAVGLRWGDLYDTPEKAAYAAAVRSEGRKFQRRYPVDAQVMERRILQIARNQIRQGKPLSVEDRARAELALERLRNG